MALLRHEVWEEPDENEQILEALCLAGPEGNAFRATLGDYAVLVATFEAASHVEAMTKYYFMYDRGEYVSAHPSDYVPFADEWRIRQKT